VVKELIKNFVFNVNGMLNGTYLGDASNPCKISPLAEFSGHTKRIRVGSNTRILSKAYIQCDKNSEISIGSDCEIHSYSRIMTYGGNISIGNLCSINPFTILYGHGGLEIGSMVRIAAHVIIIPGDHGIDDMEVPIMRQAVVRKKIVIYDNVWVGAGARILGGVTIWPGAVIAAGAVVTRDVPENSIVAGVPAKVVRSRGIQKT
jgi:acetyltransferase-like isoleucine patch superfamily enzyme